MEKCDFSYLSTDFHVFVVEIEFSSVIIDVSLNT